MKKETVKGAMIAAAVASLAMVAATVPGHLGESTASSMAANACAGKSGCKGQDPNKQAPKSSLRVDNSCSGKSGCKSQGPNKTPPKQSLLG